METKEESSLSELKDNVIRIEYGMIIDDDIVKHKITSGELKDDMWNIQNDLNVFDARSIEPAAS